MYRSIQLGRPVAAALVAVCCLAATAQAAADPNGTWKWKFTTQNGQEFELTLTLKAEGEKLTGAVTRPMGQSVDIKDGTSRATKLPLRPRWNVMAIPSPPSIRARSKAT